MAQSPALTLVARTHFVAGDLGWLTRSGVIRTLHRTRPPDDIVLVEAIEDIQPGTLGRFLEITPDHDDTPSEEH